MPDTANQVPLAGENGADSIRDSLDAAERAIEQADRDSAAASEDRLHREEAAVHAESLRRGEEEQRRAAEALTAREIAERKEIGMNLAETYRRRRREEKERRAAIAAKKKEARLRAEAQEEARRREEEERTAGIAAERAEAQKRMEESDALLSRADDVARQLSERETALRREADAAIPVTPAPVSQEVPPSDPGETAAHAPLPTDHVPVIIRCAVPTAASDSRKASPPPLYMPVPHTAADAMAKPVEESVKPSPLTGTFARLNAIRSSTARTSAPEKGAPRSSDLRAAPIPFADEAALSRPMPSPAVMPQESASGIRPDRPVTADPYPPVAPFSAPQAGIAPTAVASDSIAETEAVLPVTEPDYLSAAGTPDLLPGETIAPASPSPESAGVIPQVRPVPAPTPIPEGILRETDSTEPTTDNVKAPSQDAEIDMLPVGEDPAQAAADDARQRSAELEGYAGEWEKLQSVRDLDRKTYRTVCKRYREEEHRLAEKDQQAAGEIRRAYGEEKIRRLADRISIGRRRVEMMSYRLLGADAVGDGKEKNACEKALRTLVPAYNAMLSDYAGLTGTAAKRLPDDYTEKLIPYGRVPAIPAVVYHRPQKPVAEKMTAADLRELEKLGNASSEADALARMGGTKGGVPLREQFARDLRVNEARLTYRAGMLHYREGLADMSFGAVGAGRGERRRVRRALSLIRRARRALLSSVRSDNARYEKVASTETACARARRGADRERMEELRTRLCTLLAERDEANRRLLELYGAAGQSDIRASRRITTEKLRAASKNTRRGRKLEKRILNMRIPEGEKKALFALMNDRTSLTASLSEAKYRLRHAAPGQRDACKREMRRVRKALRANERDFARQMRRAERKSENAKKAHSAMVRTLLSLVVIAVLVGAGILVWRLWGPAIAAWFSARFGGGA